MVVITSNSEKRLPPAFLRRCVFHHIEFSRELVERAVAAWRRTSRDDDDVTPETGGTVSASQAVAELDTRDKTIIARFMDVREHPRVQRKPATAELLAWLTALDAAQEEDATAFEGPLSQLPLLSALIKDRDDLHGLTFAR